MRRDVDLGPVKAARVQGACSCVGVFTTPELNLASKAPAV